MTICPSRVDQVSSKAAQKPALEWDKTLTKIPVEYQDYANIFFLNLDMELIKNTNFYKNAIKLVKEKQPFYESIIALSPVQLKTLKAYIKTYLKMGCI